MRSSLQAHVNSYLRSLVPTQVNSASGTHVFATIGSFEARELMQYEL